VLSLISVNCCIELMAHDGERRFRRLQVCGGARLDAWLESFLALVRAKIGAGVRSDNNGAKFLFPYLSSIGFMVSST
jgi:hypothetical protein